MKINSSLKSGQKHLIEFALRTVLLTASSLLYAAAFCWLFQPNNLSVGGFTGIAQILNRFIPALPIGTATIALNIPLFIIAIKLQGFKILLYSLYCMATGSAFVDIISSLISFKPTEDKLLAAIIGGLLIGAASGIQIRAGASNGGSELCARLLKYKFRHISVGKLCMAVDFSVIILFALVFRTPYSALYGLISVYALSISLDMIVYGGNKSKGAFIVSDKSEKIRKELLSADFGATILNGRGAQKGREKQIILCAFRVHKTGALKSCVANADPDAFIIIFTASEILGERFGFYSPGEL